MPDPYVGPSTNEQERRVLAIVDEALELPEDQREAFLTQACERDHGLRNQVEQLLAACLRVEQGDPFLSDSAAAYAEPVIRAVEADENETQAQPSPHVVEALTGRYEFVREVGRGGNAVVYLARDMRHKRDVAIKIIRGNAVSEDQRTRFLREITIAAQLQHPYVVSLIDSGEVGGTVFYVMPFIDGESLRQRIDREGALPMADVLAIARDVAEALDAAHAMGVVHRDVKPQNIMLRGGHALVADFGIALALEGTGDERLTELGVAVGTPMYMSPEQASASSRIDGRSDVYSLGCVVYEMLAGEAPYPSVTPHAVRSKHLHAPVPNLAILRPAVPSAVPGVLATALAKVPAERYSTAGAFVAALTEAAASSLPRLPIARYSAVVAVLLAGAFGLWKLSSAQRTKPAITPAASIAEPDRRRIAVLYFDNVSSDQAIGHIADGLTEDLIDALSQVRGLRLISPNGVRPFRDKPPPVDSVARALQVGTVVGGSVSSSATVVRATVRLLEPQTGEQLDSHTIEVPRAEALNLREAVVAQVATFLRRRLGQEIKLAERRQETTSLAAWEAATRADELARDGAAASSAFRDADARDLLLRADSLYVAAGRLDPSWTAPTIGRGWVSLQLSIFTEPPGTTASSSESNAASTQAAARRAISFANTALERPGESAKALALRGYALQWLGTLSNVATRDSVLRQGEADLRAALDERPDDARSWYALGEVLAANGRFTESMQALRNAYDGDAYLVEARDVVNLLFFVSLNSEQFDEARRWCDLGLQRYSDGPTFVTCRFIHLGWTGRESGDVSTAWQQIAAFERGPLASALASQWGFFRLMTAAIAARAGMVDSARAIVAAARAGLATDPSRDRALDVDAYVHILLREPAEAARQLAELLRRKPQDRAQLERSPWFKEIYSLMYSIVESSARVSR